MTFDDLTTQQLREALKRAAVAKDYDEAAVLLDAFVARGPSDAAQVARLLKALAARDGVDWPGVEAA